MLAKYFLRVHLVLMKTQDDYKISFRTSFFQNMFAQLISSCFPEFYQRIAFKVMIADEGITVQPSFRKPVTINWQDIECLDVNGLKVRDKSWIENMDKITRFFINLTHEEKFFLIMTSKHDVLDKCSRSRRVWRAGINVLGITDIMPQSAKTLLHILTEKTQKHRIKEDIIVLEGL